MWRHFNVVFWWRNLYDVVKYHLWFFLKFYCVIISLQDHKLVKSRNFILPRQNHQNYLNFNFFLSLARRKRASVPLASWLRPCRDSTVGPRLSFELEIKDKKYNQKYVTQNSSIYIFHHWNMHFLRKKLFFRSSLFLFCITGFRKNWILKARLLKHKMVNIYPICIFSLIWAAKSFQKWTIEHIT